MQITRRRFMVQTGATGALISGLGSAASAQGAADQPVGLQLYTVRHALAANTPKTLDMIAGLGYSEVECAWYSKVDIPAFKTALEGSGLKAPSAHIALASLTDDFERMLELASFMGHKYLILGWLPPEARTPDMYARVADSLNRAGELAKTAGVLVGYHNHDFEFAGEAGNTPYDRLLTETDASLVKMELDLYWCAVAGVDPLSIMQRYPGRIPCVHIKDRAVDGSITDPGTGTLDFARIYAARRGAGIQHFFVEHDNSPDIQATLKAGMKTMSAVVEGG